ncbi:3-hydroxyisobutyrate dehydrogenase [Kocuria sp. HSID16901]|uniref:3-hydroxyisobutyrate dehydrogenase n=1 Tax=Kocuria sp. HSID16901 TaxID=2419505 RepID=UPI0006601579|nr:3-hydroxyisobutyrate dehydrogenase [Kocuria sp. HSID16901]MCT1367115.1 3-hydroxyisobutyrate dehydrogenase [Rothia sp. p3-SID1597]RUQ21817.1 3-hydroxyisobutyrate dehydrogenase [Kocuria sp. HSID16901]
MNIAFLGLGNMGGPMARNLKDAGHAVVAFDLMEAARENAAAEGVTIAASGADAVKDAEVVITMFPAGKHVLAAYRGTEGELGLLAVARPNTLFIDSSTISVDEAVEAAELVHEAGHRAVDAPVSGGTAGAQAGTLTFMVGGPKAHVDAAHELFDVMGKKIVHCGENGAGQAAKCCNNMLLAITTIGASEAFTLGSKLGLTDQALFDVMSTSAAQCWSVTTNCPVPGPVPTSPASNDYQPGFAAALMAKDLGLAFAALESTGTRATFGRAAHQAYTEFTEAGNGHLDFSAIIQTIREDAS